MSKTFFFFSGLLLCRLISAAQDSRSTTSVCRLSSCGSSRWPASSTQTTIVGTSFLCECPPSLTQLPPASTHTITHTSSPPKSLYCVIEKQRLPFEAFVTNYPASLIIFPSSENCWSGKNFLCAEQPFQIFQGQELNWMLLSFETLNNVLTVKRASASVFFTLATINTDNGQNGLKWFGGAQSLLQVLLFL